MDRGDTASAIMGPYLEAQSRETERVRSRKAFRAKLWLVLTAMMFSSFATLTIHRFFLFDKIDGMAIVVLLLWSGILRDRWRAM